MKQRRRKYTAEFKVKVAIEVLKRAGTLLKSRCRSRGIFQFLLDLQLLTR